MGTAIHSKNQRMNRISYTVSFLMGIVVTSCQMERQTGSSITKPVKPNILFILTDDQRADAMGCAGNTSIKTPNIDQLAITGVRFTNCYVMGGHHGAICAPSRAMLMSGKNLFQVYDNLDGVKTMPMHFAAHGYETFGTGKWHNKAINFETSFQKGKNVFLGGMSDHFNVPCRNLDENRKLTESMLKGFSTDLFAEAAIEYLQDYSKGTGEKPFFCYVSFTAPHDPRSPRKDYIKLYRDEELPLPANFKELHPFKFDDLNGRDETLAPWPRTPEMIKATLADYYALITHLDKRIGDIIHLLKKLNLFDNTIIVFASDNGLAAGSHGLLGKQNLYEHSINVPLIISGPGIPKGKEKDAMVYLFDIFPTLSTLSQLPAPGDIDGKDLNPVIFDVAQEVRNSIYTGYRNSVRAVRKENWKLIWYLQIKHIQLFNLKEDPHEKNNLAGNPDNEARIVEMMDLLINWHKSTGDTATLFPVHTLPMEYDYTKLKQIPDQHQPEYVLKKYFYR